VRLLAPTLIVALGWCGGCGSPSSPSSSPAEYQLRITESPSCKALTAGPPYPTRYGFFSFGEQTVHVKGSFTEGTFALVDDNLAHACTGQGSAYPPLQLQLARATGPADSMSGHFDGFWFPESACVGVYFKAAGAATGIRNGTSASGVLNGTLFNAIFAYNYSGNCPAPDHSWSLTPLP
jgi:hypothetical protein